MKRPWYLLPVIVFSQFAGTSLWFAGNAIAPDLQQGWLLAEQSVGYMTSAVQLGFILGTLVFAFLAIADRFSARAVFCVCSLGGAAASIAVLAIPQNLTALLVTRLLTGFFLAGIYPVGMKIAAGWYEKGLGQALGYLVGALVIGTAFPHLLRGAATDLPWQHVMTGVSLLAGLGGVLMFALVPDGPFLPRGGVFNPRALAIIFCSRAFRASAFGYFGHMWELYAFWAFLPAWLLAYSEINQAGLNVSFWAFVIIAAGFLGCVLGGIASGKLGSDRVAALQLGISGCCCILSPLFFDAGLTLFILFLVVWGVTVVGDSPQFSALNALNAPRESVGSALTIANSIGFFITVLSIQMVNILLPVVGPQFIFWLLVPGPLAGLLALRPLLTRTGNG